MSIERYRRTSGAAGASSIATEYEEGATVRHQKPHRESQPLRFAADRPHTIEDVEAHVAAIRRENIDSRCDLDDDTSDTQTSSRVRHVTQVGVRSRKTHRTGGDIILTHDRI